MRIACIIQARTTSTRLPNKVHADIGGRTMFWHVKERVTAAGVEPIGAWAEDYPELNESDVLARYTLCARRNALDAIIRVTSDCPLMAPEAIREALECFLAHKGHFYVANDWAKSWPDGMGVEVISRRDLEWCNFEAATAADREHVTLYIRRMKKFNKINILCPIIGHASLKLSVDTAEDLEYIRKIDAAQPRDYSLEATLEAIERVKAS